MSAPRVPLEGVWQFYYGEPLMASPGWRRLRCPEHEDRTASAQINTDDGRWNCFSCSFMEDAVDIVMRKENLSFPRALQFIETVIGESVAEVRGPGRRAGSVPRGERARDAGDGQLSLGARPRRRS